MKCCTPLKAYILDKQVIYEKIFTEEFKRHPWFSEWAEDKALEIYNRKDQDGKNAIKRIYFKPPKKYREYYSLIDIPCGKCEACKCNHAKEWALRCHLESLYHDQNCFITLSYNNENLPKNRSLELSDLQKFWKRLRKSLPKETKIKYFACGEYGPKTLRPHYHAIIFGYMPDDIKPWKKNHQRDQLYISEKIEKIWGKGYCIIGECNYNTAGYVARYCTKKLKNELKIKHNKAEEFIVMSRNGGIGISYYKEKKEEIWEDQGIYIKKPNKNASLESIPKFFMKKFKEEKDQRILTEYRDQMQIKKVRMKENWEEILSRTDLNEEQYLKNLWEKNKETLKKLPRSNLDLGTVKILS
ncbi:MAG: hypothetical protein HDQ88_04565 [Clostridia bacterium]|nr:hypothetical protein [Clostridia bacterium]